MSGETATDRGCAIEDGVEQRKTGERGVGSFATVERQRLDLYGSRLCLGQEMAVVKRQ